VYLTVGHHGFDVIVDGLFGVGSVIRLWRFTPACEPGLVQVGVIGRVETSAGRVVGARPVLTPVVEVAQLVEVFLPARRESIVGLTC